MKKINKKQALQETLAKVRRELSRIEAAERLKANRGLVGKCYVYRNSYSCPETEADYWPLYKKIISLDEFGNFQTLQFENDNSGQLTIKSDKWGSLHGDYVEITQEEFEQQAERFLKAVAEALGFEPRRLEEF